MLLKNKKIYMCSKLYTAQIYEILRENIYPNFFSSFGTKKNMVFIGYYTEKSFRFTPGNQNFFYVEGTIGEEKKDGCIIEIKFIYYPLYRIINIISIMSIVCFVVLITFSFICIEAIVLFFFCIFVLFMVEIYKEAALSELLRIFKAKYI